MLIRILAALAAGLWVLLLHSLASTPADDLPGRWPHGVSNLLHAATHAVLAVLLLRALVPWRPAAARWPGSGSRTGMLVFALCVLHGLFEETVQHSVTGRSCSSGDLLLDALGAAVVLCAPWPAGPARPQSLRCAILVVALMPVIAFGAELVPALDGSLSVLLTACGL